MVQNIIDIQTFLAKDLHALKILGRPLQKGPLFIGDDESILDLKSLQYFGNFPGFEALQGEIIEEDQLPFLIF